MSGPDACCAAAQNVPDYDGGQSPAGLPPTGKQTSTQDIASASNSPDLSLGEGARGVLDFGG